MVRREVYVGSAITCGVVAFVGALAIYEHWAGLKGPEWMEKIFPFGLTLDLTTLVALAVIAAVLAWLFQKLAKERE